MKPEHQLAFWIAVLCTILMLPKIWIASGWLGEQFLEPDFGPDLTWVLRPFVFFILVMVGLFSARATFVSSFGLIMATIILKFPF